MIDNHLAPALELLHHVLHFDLDTLVCKSNGRRVLRRMIGPARNVALQSCHCLRHFGRRQRKTDAPTRHSVRLRHPVDDNDTGQKLVREIEYRRRRTRGVVNAAIDLVTYQPQIATFRPFGDRAQFRQRVDRAGRVVWRTQQ